MFTVTCLDDGTKYQFVAMSPYDALTKMVYYLNLSHYQNVIINKTESGKHLYFEHCGKTYAIKN